MRLSRIATLVVFLPVLACKGGSADAPTAPEVIPAEPSKVGGGVEENSGAVAEPGNIKIKVMFEGAAPQPQPLNRKSDPYCGKTPKDDPSVIVEDGALHNVVVKIAGKVKGEFTVPTEPVKIDQKECMYEPRISTAMVGQKLEVSNSDGTLHNVHGLKGAKEENWFNRAQPPKANVITGVMEDELVRLKCDVHPWMSAWISASKHTFNKVANSGVVEFSGVPSRAKAYKVVTWHESLGTQEVDVVVEAGKTTEITVIYKG